MDIFKILIFPYIWSSRDPTIKTHGDSVGYKTLVMKNIRRIPLILFCSFVFHDLTNGVKLILPVRLPCNSHNMQNFLFTNILDPTNQYYLARRSAYMVSHYALLITSPYRIPQLQQTNFILITFPDPSRVELLSGDIRLIHRFRHVAALRWIEVVKIYFCQVQRRLYFTHCMVQCTGLDFTRTFQSRNENVDKISSSK